MDNKAPSPLPNESNASLQPSAIQPSEALPNARQSSVKKSSSKQINQKQVGSIQSSTSQSSANAQPFRNLQPALEDQAIDIDSILSDTA